MIELTTDQLQVLARPQESPPRVLDLQTRQTYVLLPLADYQRLIEGEGYEDGAWTDEERDRLRLEACEMLDSFGKDAGRSTAVTS